MTGEPASSAGISLAIYKLLTSLGLTVPAFGIGAMLASVVVMCMTLPRTAREWTVGIISTVVGSVGGGAFVIVHYGLLVRGAETTVIEAAAIIGIVFTCGLPAWGLVRMTFNWIEKRKDKDIAEVIHEGLETVNEVKAAL
jgi:hypothetical protein